MTADEYALECIPDGRRLRELGATTDLADLLIAMCPPEGLSYCAAKAALIERIKEVTR